jgi:hypothetical protein
MQHAVGNISREIIDITSHRPTFSVDLWRGQIFLVRRSRSGLLPSCLQSYPVKIIFPECGGHHAHHVRVVMMFGLGNSKYVAFNKFIVSEACAAGQRC